MPYTLDYLGLSPDCWLPLIRGRIPQSYAAGQMIYLQDTEAEQFYYLLHGKVKTFISSAGGNERTLTVYGSGSLFGEASFFGRMPRVSSAVALIPSAIVSIDREQAAQALTRNPELTMAMLQYLARTVQLLSGHVDEITFRPAEQRLAALLLDMDDRSGDGRLSYTQDDLASSIGVSRVTVSRTLSRFAKAGWVKTEYGGLRLLDRDALRRLLG